MSFSAYLATYYRLCQAVGLPGGAVSSNIYMNNLTPAVVGDTDSHNNLGALINVLPHNVNIGPGLISAIPSIISMASPDVMGLVPHPQGLPIPMQGSPNVFIGQGTGAAGIGMMQMLGPGMFGGLQMGELVAMGSQIIGLVQNFTFVGGGTGVAQLSNLQPGAPILASGTQITGLSSGYTFTFGAVVDSRTTDNVLGAASFDNYTANSFPDVTYFGTQNDILLESSDDFGDLIFDDTMIDAYLMDDGSLISTDIVDTTASVIAISDYFTMYPTYNLTASTISVNYFSYSDVIVDLGDILVCDDGYSVTDLDIISPNPISITDVTAYSNVVTTTGDFLALDDGSFLTWT
jgi:hypothetical protein